MSNHADDSRIGRMVVWVEIESQVLANWIAIREIFFRQAFINDGDGLGMLIIGSSEKASALERDLHDFEVIRLHNILQSHGQITLVGGQGPINIPEIFFV